MTKDEAIRLALAALVNAPIEYDFHGNPMDAEFGKQLDAAVQALRQALKQPRQECETCANKRRRLEQAGFLKSPLRGEETRPQQNPVAYLYHDTVSAEFANPLADSTLLVLACDRKPNGRNETPLYTAPPKSEWVGLTQREIIDLRNMINWMTDWSYGTFAYAIEQKLKEKNRG